MKILTGYNSEENSYLQEDYPYGFNLRCSRKVWIETKKGYGQRFVTQTNCPKTGKWNKPKAGNYNSIVIMYLNEENNHVEFEVLNAYCSEDKINEFVSKFESGFGDYERVAVRYMLAACRVSKMVTWKVVTGEAAKDVPSIEEQSRQFHNLVIKEMT